MPRSFLRIILAINLSKIKLEYIRVVQCHSVTFKLEVNEGWMHVILSCDIQVQLFIIER